MILKVSFPISLSNDDFQSILENRMIKLPGKGISVGERRTFYNPKSNTYISRYLYAVIDEWSYWTTHI